MSDSVDCPFGNGEQVIGMQLPKYLAWAMNTNAYKRKLLLPPIQRGFVWKPKQIIELWDSLLRGMPIGSLMVCEFTKDQKALSINSENRKTVQVDTEAMGLLDGQQRTLAMLLGWPESQSSQYCLWIDLGEYDQAGTLFELRITTKTQPFGYQRFSHTRLSKSDRKLARDRYDADVLDEEYKNKLDCELFGLDKIRQPRPWKAGKSTIFLRLRDAWEISKKVSDKKEYIEKIKCSLQVSKVDENTLTGLLYENTLTSLYEAFKRLESLQVPLILLPEYIKQPPKTEGNSFTPSPLILLFERIGRNGSSLSSEDLLFSMIKQQWPEAHDLVEKIHSEIEVKWLMSSTDYVTTAYRLGSAQIGIADNPRPNPNDFHRNLGKLLSEDGKKSLPLDKYLKEDTLVSAFNALYGTLKYKGGEDLGIPSLMMPHFSRGLIQVLLRWILLNPDEKMIMESRHEIIAFVLFWYLCVWKAEDDNRASKKAFEFIKEGKFPATELYKILTDAQTKNDIGMALPLISPERLEDILIAKEPSLFRSSEEIFRADETGKLDATVQEQQLCNRFLWWRKPLLLWIQRKYVHKVFESNLSAEFVGLTDEDNVPYDYDHLCPQNHWGADWRNISVESEDSNVKTKFRNGRTDVGNCIGNLHVLESSLNRSFGDAPLETKLEQSLEQKIKWEHQDSFLYECDEDEAQWKLASPAVDEKWNKTWSETRLQAFQSSVYGRAKRIYSQYYEVCKNIIFK